MEARAPGRPRSEESRQAILTSALGLAAEVGYGNLTIEGIAARAGVGKQTIYRWWPSKGDVLLEATIAEANLGRPTEDQGSYAGDLRAFLTSSYETANHSRLVGVLRALMAEAQIDPGFRTRFHSAFLEPRREALAVIVDRARRRGDLPATPTLATIAEVVLGTAWYRVLASDNPLDADLVEDLVALLSGAPPELPRPLTVHPRVAKRAPLPWRGSRESSQA